MKTAIVKLLETVDMKLVFLIMLLLSSSVSFAGEHFMTVNMAAYHFNRGATQDLNFNEKNFGLGYEYKKEDTTYHVGYYENSVRKTSLYALVSYSPLHLNNIDIGVVGGGITGYNIEPIAPAFGASVTIASNTVAMNIMLVPEVQSLGVYGFAGFQLKFKI